MNPNLSRLQPYPFERVAALKAGITPPDLPHLSLAIGEPRHPTPHLISQAVLEHLHRLSSYPTTRGLASLRQAITNWLEKRFKLPAACLHADRHVLPVNGTREALFAFAQCVLNGQPQTTVMMPNPFYQIYEGAALLAGAEPVFLSCVQDNGFLPDYNAITPVNGMPASYCIFVHRVIPVVLSPP